MNTSSVELPLAQGSNFCGSEGTDTIQPGHIQVFLTLSNQLNIGELIKDVQSFLSVFIINATMTQYFRQNLQWKGRKHAFQIK